MKTNDDYISREAALIKVWRAHLTKDEKERLMEEIKSISAADVRLVKRGEWIGAYDDLKCSECGKNWDELRTADGDDWGYWEYKPPYCPNCGADMREVE